MLCERPRALVVIALVLVAGCAGPFGSMSTPTPSAGPTPTATESHTATPTTEPGESLPPGLSSDGIENASQLLAAHVDALNKTGFVGVGSGNGTVFRNGFLVDVQTHQQNVVAPNATTYQRERRVNAGPIGQHWQAWANDTVEYRRTDEEGQWAYSREPRAPMAKLAGRGLLLPYLEGGNYSLDGAEEVNGTTRYRLVATEVEDAEALQEALPQSVEQITAFNATVMVDATGRVHSVRAVVEYVIRGQEASHHLDYSLEQVGGITVDRPAWVTEAKNTTGNP